MCQSRGKNDASHISACKMYKKLRGILFMNGKKRKFYKQICFILSFFCFFTITPVWANTEDSQNQVTEMEETEHKTVRVGWYEDSYHITDKNGDRSGYGYEFEQAVSAYTGWDWC